MIESFRSLIDERLETLYPSDGHPLKKACHYSLFSGGKRLRPLLLLTVVKTFDSSLEEALDPAITLELIHTYSLIQDDLPAMDDDDLRRGKPSLHRAFSEGEALLASDLLHLETFQLLSSSPLLPPHKKVELIDLITRQTGIDGIIGGQYEDLLTPPEKATFFQMQEKKTASLFTLATLMGAVLVDATPEEKAILLSFGHSFGKAFQLLDDLLDSETGEVSNSTQVVGQQETEKRLQTEIDQLLGVSLPRHNTDLLQELLSHTFQTTPLCS